MVYLENVLESGLTEDLVTRHVYMLELTSHKISNFASGGAECILLDLKRGKNNGNAVIISALASPF